MTSPSSTVATPTTATATSSSQPVAPLSFGPYLPPSNSAVGAGGDSLGVGADGDGGMPDPRMGQLPPDVGENSLANSNLSMD